MLNIEQWIYRTWQDYALYGSTDIRVDCPFCYRRVGKHDIRRKLHISLYKPTCHCFRCGYSRSWVGLVMDASGVSYADALGELYCVPHALPVDDIRRKISNSIGVMSVDRASLPDDFEELDEACGALADTAKQYLIGRGFSEDLWSRYMLGIAQSVGYRVVIPIEDEYWQARSLKKFISPKYINPPKSSDHVLFNAAALNMYDEVVVCEGAFSAMAVGDNAIALIGKGTKPKICRLVNSRVPTFVIALDSDAIADAVALAKTLHRAGKHVVVWKYSHGDPASTSEFVEMEFTVGNELRMLLEC